MAAMIKGLALLALVALLGAAAGCDAGTPGPPAATPTAQQTPADFSVKYEWVAGSMPPPYHYEYSFTIGPGTQGKAVMVPNYPGEGIPEWTETFSVSEADMRSLYALVTEKKLIRDDWPGVQDPPVGGSLEWAEITADGRTVSLPSQIAAPAQSAAQELYERVKSLVPKEQWDKLVAQREKYEADYQDR